MNQIHPWGAKIATFGSWTVHRMRCREHGQTLRGLTLPRVPHPLADDPELAILAECLTAVVCHATNWDRLRGHLLHIAVTDRSRLAPVRLASMPFESFVEEFGTAFAEDVQDMPRRHEMFTTTAAAFVGSRPVLDRRHLAVSPQRLGGDEGLYALLDRIEPFSADPQRKKARVFVQQMLRFNIITVSDPDKLRLAVEHHLIRLYLRTGRVTPQNGRSDRRQLDQISDLDVLTALREAVEYGMRCTAAAANLSLNDINEIEWQVGRSYCERSAPRCAGPVRPDKPVVASIEDMSGGKCIFAGICIAQSDTEMAGLREPELSSAHGFY